MPPRALRVTLGTLARLTHADGRGKGLLTGVFRKSCFRVVRTGFGLHGQDPLRTVVDLYNFARPDLHRTVRSCPLRWCVVAMNCRFVTHAGNARSFLLCSLKITIVAAAEAYACRHERKDFEPARGRGWASVPAGRVLGRLRLDHGRAAFRTFRLDGPRPDAPGGRLWCAISNGYGGRKY